MLHRLLALGTLTLSAIAATACTTETAPAPTLAAPPANEPTNEQGDDAGSPGAVPSSPPETSTKGIGTYTEKGLAHVPVDVSLAPISCTQFCTSRAGKCTPSLVLNGSDQVWAGDATYYAPPSSLQVPRGLMCDDVATKTYRESLYAPNVPTLGRLTCSCDDVPVAPRVLVPAGAGKSCNDVCTSWTKTCDPKRAWEFGGPPTGGVAIYKSGDSADLDCTSVPATSQGGSALDSYICACRL